MAGRWTFIFTGGCNPTTPTVLPIMTLNQFSRVVTGDLISPAAWCNVPAGQTGKLDPAAPASIDEQGNFTGARLKVGSFARHVHHRANGPDRACDHRHHSSEPRVHQHFPYGQAVALVARRISLERVSAGPISGSAGNRVSRCDF